MPFIAMLDDAINVHYFSPKEIRIGLMLWKVLEEDGRIKWRRGASSLDQVYFVSQSLNPLF